MGHTHARTNNYRYNHANEDPPTQTNTHTDTQTHRHTDTHRVTTWSPIPSFLTLKPPAGRRVAISDVTDQLLPIVCHSCNVPLCPPFPFLFPPSGILQMLRDSFCFVSSILWMGFFPSDPVLWDARGCSGMHGDSSGFFRILPDSQGFFGIYCNYWALFGIRQILEMLGDAWGCLGMLG